MSDEPTKKVIDHREPSKASLDEMPELNEQRFRRRPGRGHHVHRSIGEIVMIDAELWAHFGSENAVNAALRNVVNESKKASGS